MRETLYLIDAYAQIFRAYFAIRNGMRSPVTSEPTHAVFGFTDMLLKLFSTLHPHYVVVAYDAPGRSFRDDMYSEYKATRNATPEDLSAQIPRVMELIELFGIPLIGVPGLEADDVIATITHRICTEPQYEGVQVRIVSKDKDLEQLLCDRVEMFDIHTDTVLDVPGLREKKGITPEQVIDVLALMGDTSDNVPGVRGIGPKTAAQLVQQFGSIDGILENMDQLKGKVRENLEAGRDQLLLSRTLVTLKREADFGFSLEEARVRPPNVPKLISFFQQLGFNRFQDSARRLGDEMNRELSAPSVLPGLYETTVASVEESTSVQLEASAEPITEASAEPITEASAEPAAEETPPGTAADGVYEGITSLGQLEDLVATLRSQPIISFDTETTGLGRDSRICGFSFAWKPGHGVYVPIASPDPERTLDEGEALAMLAPLLEDPAMAKCGHNLKFDARMLLNHGVHLRGVAFDSMLAATLLDPGQSAQLDQLALARLNYRMIPISELIGGGTEQTTIDAVPLDRVIPYAAEDADIALRLKHLLEPELDRYGMSRLLREIEAPLGPVLAEMEANGILCDPDELRRQGDALKIRADELRREVQRAAGVEFHVDSPKQLGEVLFDKLGLAAGKKTKTGRSTDIEVLEKLASQEDPANEKTSVPRLVIQYRQLQKLLSAYLGSLIESIDPRTGRIHTNFHQLVTATGRLASHGPNLQNIPVRSEIGRQIRKAFFAPPGQCLICADYSQIELRLLAHLSGDPALIAAFENDEDIHTAVAAQVFNIPSDQVTRKQRNHAKTINFGIIYGITPFGLARRIEGLDVPGAQKLIEDYRQKFSGIDTFLQECVHHALDYGYVSTILGRRRAIRELSSSNHSTRSLGERLAINSVVQGSAADLIKIAMVNVQRRIDREKLPLRMLLQVHDELVLESPAELCEEQAVIVREEMSRAMELRVPLKAEAGIGTDWMSAK